MNNRIWNETNHTAKNSKGQYRLKNRVKMASAGLYFLFVAMVIAFTLVVIR
jgi:hypothetical protein